MNGEKKLLALYAVLLILLGMFFASLFFFVTSARQLHSEGVLRRPPKPGSREPHPTSRPPAPDQGAVPPAPQEATSTQ